MSFISYAQNYEDVMLARALRGVEKGFYIDVGAQDPVNDSVTKALYELGWRGISIEPVTHWFERLVADRPRDINLQVAVSDHPGTLHLFEVVDSGLSTTDPAFAERHVRDGRQIRESDIACVTLDSICEAHQVNEVHFLKIDCEGAEEAALRGLSLDRIRPWIILLEATEPNSQKPAYQSWEPLLTDRGYHFAYEDGLNRFYVADEHRELDQAFTFPPNVFDQFVRAPEAAARDALGAVQAELVGLRHNVQHLHGENERREEALADHRRMLASAAERDRIAQAEVHRLQDEILRGQGEIPRLQGEIQRLQGEIPRLQGDNERLQGETLRLQGETLRLQGDNQRSQVENQRSQAEIQRLHGEIQRLQDETGRLYSLIQLIHHSLSWRITAPLRWMKRQLRKLARFPLRIAFRALRWVARLLRPLLRFVAKWPWVRSLIVRMLGTESPFAARVQLALYGPAPAPAPVEEVQEAQHTLPPMTRRAARVLEELQDASEAGTSSRRPTRSDKA